jgi:hypothetical protein
VGGNPSSYPAVDREFAPDRSTLIHYDDGAPPKRGHSFHLRLFDLDNTPPTLPAVLLILHVAQKIAWFSLIDRRPRE